MATPGKLTKKEGKKQTPVKTSFTSPFALKWSPLPQEDMQFILKTVQEKLIATGLEKKEEKVFRPWRRKKEQKPTPVPQPDVQLSQDAEQDPVKNGWSNAAARRQLAIGINEVTKALERNELRLVLVCKSVKPPHMTSHLITLSVTRGVPACQVPRLSQTVSEPLGLKSVLALGFRQCPSAQDELFTDVVDVIKPRVPTLHVKWLQDTAAELVPEKSGEGKKKDASERSGEKRKLESESEKEIKSPLYCTLQPLKVKRIVANPAKKRKVKPKK